MKKKGSLVKASLITASANQQGSLFCILASAKEEIPNVAVAKFSCRQCSTVFASNKSTKLHPHCVTCGSEETEITESEDLPIEEFSENEVASMHCVTCGTHNIVSLAGAVSFDNHLHCVTCSTELSYELPQEVIAEIEGSEDEDFISEEIDVELDDEDDTEEAELEDIEEDDDLAVEDQVSELDVSEDLDAEEADFEDDEDLDEILNEDIEDDIDEVSDFEDDAEEAELEDDADAEEDLDIEADSEEEIDIEVSELEGTDTGKLGKEAELESTPAEKANLTGTDTGTLDYDELDNIEFAPQDETLVFDYSADGETLAAFKGGVIVATLNKKDASSEYANVFNGVGLTRAVKAYANKSSERAAFEAFGFTLATSKIPVDKIIKAKVEKEIASQRKEIATANEGHKEILVQSLQIATAGISKNMWRNIKNPLLEELASELAASTSVKNPRQLATRIITAAMQPTLEAILAKAHELSTKSNEFRNELAETLLDSNTIEEDEDEISVDDVTARLQNGVRTVASVSNKKFIGNGDTVISALASTLEENGKDIFRSR